jgi:hypothetical protein
VTTSKSTTVVLLGTPVGLAAASSRWFDELIRELEIIASGDEAAPPRSFLQLASRVREMRTGTRGRDAIEEALEADRASVDLELEVPPEAGAVALDLWDRYREIDAYCRDGGLLTIAATPEVHAFVDWYLHEIAGQLDGRAPRPWRGSSGAV